MKHDKLQVAFASLVLAAALGMAVMGYGLYQQGQHIKNLQHDQADQTDYLCVRLSSLAQRIATRTDPIRSLLQIEANEADERGKTKQAARLQRMAKKVIVPQGVDCDRRVEP